MSELTVQAYIDCLSDRMESLRARRIITPRHVIDKLHNAKMQRQYKDLRNKRLAAVFWRNKNMK